MNSAVLRRTAQKIFRVMVTHGLDPFALASLRHLPRFVTEARRYAALSPASGFAFSWQNLWPILSDYTAQAGVTRSHYFVMDLFMARQVLAAKPKRHLDIGSRLDGFVAHLLAAGQPVEVIDIRPLADVPEGLSFLQADATTLKGLKKASVQSLSCLHAIEHFGLGRYGDPIDPHAPYKLLKSVARVMAKGGLFYFATPVGDERLEFNAHRVFDPQKLESHLTGLGFKVRHRAVITTPGLLKKRIMGWGPYRAERYACGLWVLQKTGTA